MTISDWLVIVAIIVAPIIAVQIQKIIESRKETRNRKMHVFKALMATRATPLYPAHVEALNMIDIEFYKEKKVVESWKLLHDNFFNYPKDTEAKDFDARLSACSDKSNNLLTDLLYEMSKVLDYDFDKVLLKRGCYIPKGHGDFESEQNYIRQGLASLFRDGKPFPIKVIEDEDIPSQEKQTIKNKIE